MAFSSCCCLFLIPLTTSESIEELKSSRLCVNAKIFLQSRRFSVKCTIPAKTQDHLVLNLYFSGESLAALESRINALAVKRKEIIAKISSKTEKTKEMTSEDSPTVIDHYDVTGNLHVVQVLV